MRIPCQPQVDEVVDRLISTRPGDDSLLGETPQDLCDLKIQQMRGMQSLAMPIDSPLNTLTGSCLEKPINRSGRTQDNHRASRSSRTSRAVSICAGTGLRLCKRSRNSASVGLSAISLISASRYSDSDMPARAARAFKLRCNASGTLRS